MPLYGQHVTPRQASSPKSNYPGGGDKHLHFLTSWRSVPGGGGGGGK